MTKPEQPNSKSTEESMKLLNTQQAADFLGIPEATLRHWRHVRIGPRSVRLGRHVRYIHSDLEAYVRQHVEAEEAERQKVAAA